MAYISKKMYHRNVVEAIVDSDGILCLSEKHIEEELDHKNLRVTTINYLSYHRKHRYKLVDEPQNNPISFPYLKN